MFFLEVKKFFRTRGVGISIAVIMLCMFLNSINNTGLLNKYKKGIEANDGEDTTKYENQLLDTHTGILYSEEKYEEMLLVSESLYEGTDSEGEEPGRFGPAKKYDKWLYETLLSTMAYLGEFKDSLSDVIYNAEQVKENNKYLGEYSDPYKEKEADAVISAYTRIRENTLLKLVNTRGAYMYCWSETEGINRFNYQLLILFLCCIISIYFTSETAFFCVEKQDCFYGGPASDAAKLHNRRFYNGMEVWRLFWGAESACSVGVLFPLWCHCTVLSLCRKRIHVGMA